MTTIASAKSIIARSVFLLSAVFGGWATSAIISAPITAVEHAMIRPCEDDACGSLFVNGPDGYPVDTGIKICVHNDDSGMNCNMREDGECVPSRCCPWWKPWC